MILIYIYEVYDVAEIFFSLPVYYDNTAKGQTCRHMMRTSFIYNREKLKKKKLLTKNIISLKLKKTYIETQQRAVCWCTAGKPLQQAGARDSHDYWTKQHPAMTTYGQRVWRENNTKDHQFCKPVLLPIRVTKKKKKKPSSGLESIRQ